MIYVLILIYGCLLMLAVSNFMFMGRPKKLGRKHEISALVSANENDNELIALLPQLVKEVAKVYVYAENCSDDMIVKARELGAFVIIGYDTPANWNHDNYAKYQLSLIASEDSPHEWWIFLNADSEVKVGFGNAISSLIEQFGSRNPVMTGYCKITTGSFYSQITNFWFFLSRFPFQPIGLKSLLKTGKAKELSPAFQLWKASKYSEIQPHHLFQKEDKPLIKIGNHLYQSNIRIETVLIPDYMTLKLHGILKPTPSKYSILTGLSCLILLAATAFWPVSFIAIALIAGVVSMSIKSFPMAFVFAPLTMVWRGITMVFQITKKT